MMENTMEKIYKICEYGCESKANYQFKNGKYCCSQHWSKCQYIRSQRRDNLKGKSYIEIYGKVKAQELRKLRSEEKMGRVGWNKGKTYEEVYGKEKAKDIKNKMSEKLKDRSYEDLHGKEKAKEIKRNQSISRKDISWVQKFGKEKAKELRANQANRSRKYKGMTYEDRYGEKKSKIIKRKLKNIRKDKTYEEVYGKSLSKKIKKQISIGNKRTIKKIKQKYPLFSKIEEMRYDSNNPDEKEIQVHCKNHRCPNSKEEGGWFTPDGRQIENRISSLENKGNDLSYFYCSEQCKNECPLYNLRSDPFKIDHKSHTQSEYQTFRKYVLERDNYKCQYCGEKAEHVHHERPQKLEPFFALDPDLAWSVCKQCHYEKAHKTRSECSTGNLSKIICPKKVREFIKLSYFYSGMTQPC